MRLEKKKRDFSAHDPVPFVSVPRFQIDLAILMGVYKQRDLDLNPRNFPALIKKGPLHIEIDYKNELTISFLKKKKRSII